MSSAKDKTPIPWVDTSELAFVAEMVKTPASKNGGPPPADDPGEDLLEGGDDDGGPLAPRHRKILEAAAISEDRIAQVRTARSVADLPPGFESWGKKAVPSMVFTWATVSGRTLSQIRLDVAIDRPGGKKSRYLFPKGFGGLVGIDRAFSEHQDDTRIPALLVEGTKQFAAVASLLSSANPVAVPFGIPGCSGWSYEGQPCADLKAMALEGREVLVCFDADLATKPDVYKAASRLRGHLLGPFAASRVRFLAVPGKGSTGIDDVLGAIDTEEERRGFLLDLIDKAAELPAEGPREPGDELTHRQKLAIVHAKATELMKGKVPATDRMVLLRACAHEFGLRPNDSELLRCIWRARREGRGSVGAVEPGEALDLSETRWLCEGLILVACLNLLVGLPKAGKTSLFVAMVAVWHRGASEFLGLPLIGPCPPVLLVGVDMPQNDWGHMLKEFGLMGDDNRLQAPIVGLFHKGRPITLDLDGVEQIAAYAEKHPGLLIMLDSYAELTRGLGVAEKDADFAEPISDLVESVAPFGATVVLLHHSGKERATGGASEASRGTTALPALSSQNLNIYPAARGEDWAADRRRVIAAEGRGGHPVKLLIERVPGGWESLGSPAAVELAKKMQEAEDSLVGRHPTVLSHVRERWEDTGLRSTAKYIAEKLGLKGDDGERAARRNLDQLTTKKLLRMTPTIGPAGRSNEYEPVELGGGADTSRDKTPRVSAVSAPPREGGTTHESQNTPECPDLSQSSSGGEGADTPDTQEKLSRVREGARDGSAPEAVGGADTSPDPFLEGDEPEPAPCAPPAHDRPAAAAKPQARQANEAPGELPGGQTPAPMPRRLRFRRGEPLPAGAIYVGRPSPWGNPFTVEEHSRQKAVELFEQHLLGDGALLAAVRLELAGKDLACWCGPDELCHADVLLREANLGKPAPAAKKRKAKPSAAELPLIPEPGPLPAEDLVGSDPATTLVIDLETKSADHLWQPSNGTGPFVRLIGTDQGVSTSLESLEHHYGALVAHNGFGFDFLALARHHELPLLELAEDGKLIDTMVAALALDPPKTLDSGKLDGGQVRKLYSLDNCAERAGLPGKTDDLAKLASTYAKAAGHTGKPTELAAAGYGLIHQGDQNYISYLRGDVAATRALFDHLCPDGTLPPYAQREMRIMGRLVAGITLAGTRLDVELTRARYAEVEARKEACRSLLVDHYGLPTQTATGALAANPIGCTGGTEAIDRAAADVGIKLPRTEKTGKPSTSKEHLGPMLDEARAAGRQEQVDLLETILGLTGARSVYGTALDCLQPDGRVHPQVAPLQASGRFSITAPAITVFGKRGGRVIERAIFLPDSDDHVLVAADLSQIDMRAMAAHAQDPAYMELFAPGRDAHTEIAAAVGLTRNDAKAIGHGWNYGMGVEGMVRHGIDRALAEKFDSGMRRRFPRLVAWRDRIRDKATAGKRLDNGFGRRMRPNPTRAHTQAPSLMGQGTARDLMMEAVLRLPVELVPMLRFLVHDELVFSIPLAEADRLEPLILEAMNFEWAPPGADLQVPVTADLAKRGRNWADCYRKD